MYKDLKFSLSLKFLFIFITLLFCLHTANVDAVGMDTFTTKSFDTLPSNAMSDVAYGNGIYIAVGYYGAIIKSSDTEHWENVKTSADITYTGVSIPSSFCFNGVAYGNGTFVVGGSEGVVLTSTDGMTWTQRVSNISAGIGSVEYLQFKGSGAFYALTQGKFLKSTDGITWSSVIPTELDSSIWLTEVTVGNGTTRLAFGDSAGNIYSTTDGTNWTKTHPLQPEGWASTGTNMLTWMNDRYYISDPNAYIWTSTDLTDFTLVGSPFKQNNLQNGNQMFTGFYDGTQYYLFGYQSPYGYGAVYTSTNGTSWTMQPFTNEFVTQNAVYINSKYFRVGNEGLLVASNGSDWEYKWGGTFYEIVHDGSKYIAVGAQGNDGAIWTSNDLASWNNVTPSPHLKYLQAAAFGNGKYVAIGSLVGTTTSLATSTNGTDWTVNTSITDSSNISDLAFGNGKFIAVGQRSTSPVIKTSFDGVLWSEAALPVNTIDALFSVTYDNNQFIALGYGYNTAGSLIDGLSIWTSSDGENWFDKSNTYPVATDILSNIIYDGNKYILTGYDCVTYEMFSRSSVDLATWSDPTVMSKIYSYNGSSAQLAQKGNNIYMLVSDINWNPKIYYSNDQGQTWQDAGVTDVNLSYPYALMEVNNQVIISGNSQLALTTTTTDVAPQITGQPQIQTKKTGENASFSVVATGTDLLYQWQVNTGAGFMNINNNSAYSGATTDTLTITGATLEMNGFMYRVVVSGSVLPVATSNGASLVVGKLDITGVSFNNVIESYDGSQKSIQISGDLPDGVTVSYSNNTGTNAGTYNATATILGGTNYNNSTLNATLTINKAILTATVGSYNKTYGENNPEITVEVVGYVNGETPTTSAGYIVPVASSAATTSTDVGTASITISGGQAINYTFDVTDTGLLTINKKTLIASAIASGKSYDGTVTASGTINLDGIINSDLVNAAGFFEFDNVNAGIGKTVYASDITLGGTDSGNYTVNNTATTIADISKANISGISFVNSTKTYDGTVKTIVFSGTLPAGASVEYTDNTGTNVGAYNATATILGGINYNNSTLNATLTIEKANISGITFGNTTTTYDGTMKTIEISGTLPAGASVEYSGNTGTNVGAYNATATITGGTNYNNSTLNATLTIEKANISGITFGNTTTTYDGTMKTIEISGTLPTGASVDYSGNTGTIAGPYNATATILGGSNYSDTELNATLTINKAILTAKVGNYNKTYGENNPDITVEVVGFVNGETPTTSAGYVAPTASSAATTLTDVGTVSIAISGGQAINYTFDVTDTGLLTINKKTLIASAIASGKSYDGTVAASGTINLDGIINSDLVNATGILEFDNVNAGTGKTVYVSDITLEGTDSGNYTVNITTTTIANMSPKEITATSTANTKVFDGNTQATGTVSLNGVVGADDVTASGTFEFEDASVGEDKLVNVTNMTLGGVDAGNYILNNTVAIASADITKEIQSIAVTTLPPKNIYAYGEAFDPSAGVITITYNDNSTSTTALSLNMCSVASTPAIGERIVTVSYLEKTTTFSVSYNKAAQTSPEAPECIVTEEGIVVISPLGEEYEYSKDGGMHWQQEVTFTGLNHGTQYTIIARLDETITHNASNPSQGIVVTFLETTAPTITLVQATRTGHTGALVKIISNEQGSYYYAVVDAGTVEPDFNTSVAGIDCLTGEITINLTLTPGSKDFYIKVKDLAGNVSNVLKIIIPAYVLTDGERATEDLKAITWDEIRGNNISPNIVTDNLNLSVTGSVYGSNISWTSTNPGIVDITGVITRPTYEQGDANLTVTASVYNGGTGYIKDFEIVVLKLSASNNPKLSGIILNSGTLSPAFGTDETSYNCNVSYGTSSITITPEADDAYSLIKINGNTLADGSYAVSLNEGNNIITITVIAQDGVTEKVYTINVYRSAESSYNNNNNNNNDNEDNEQTSDVGVDVLVNGIPENAGKATKTTNGNQSVTTITVDTQKLAQKIESAANNSIVTVPVYVKSDVVIAAFSGDMIDSMENKQVVLEIETDNASYKLPAEQINIEDISTQLGTSELKDIKVNIQISKSTEDTVKIVEDSAQKGNFTIITSPIEFTVTCEYGNKVVPVSSFNTYVERTIAIPVDVDPNKITTGIIIDTDGTVRHVPTQIIIIEGKYYAKINSLTNSTYSVVWNPMEFTDAANHWAKEAINDLGSRVVISGTGNNMFEPNKDITRAEFAAIIVKALGLKPESEKNSFLDVNATSWYAPYIETAYEYDIISGYGNNKFGPLDKITREEAMTMIAKAMKITDLKVELSISGIEKILAEFGDSVQSAQWSKDSIAKCIQGGIVSGKSDKKLAPKDNITRSEVAVIVRKLLQKSNLI